MDFQFVLNAKSVVCFIRCTTSVYTGSRTSERRCCTSTCRLSRHATVSRCRWVRNAFTAFFFLLINSMLSIYWIFGKCISYCGFPEFYFLYISLTLTWILIHMLRLLFWYICSIYYNLYLSYQCYVSCAVVLFPEIPYLHFWFHSLFDAKKTIYLLIYWFPQVFSAIRHWILCEKNGHSDRP